MEVIKKTGEDAFWAYSNELYRISYRLKEIAVGLKEKYPLLTKALMFRAYEVEEIAKALEEVGE